MQERKQFTEECKEGAVRLVTEQRRTIADAARSLGISPWTRAAVGQSGDEFGKEIWNSRAFDDTGLVCASSVAGSVVAGESVRLP